MKSSKNDLVIAIGVILIVAVVGIVVFGPWVGASAAKPTPDAIRAISVAPFSPVLSSPQNAPHATEQLTRTKTVSHLIRQQTVKPNPIQANKLTPVLRQSQQKIAANGYLPPLRMDRNGALPPLQPLMFEPPSRPSGIWLSGIIQGSPSVAVLRNGDKRYLVRQGETVEGMYRVTKIENNSVTLQRGSRTRTLRLGAS